MQADNKCVVTWKTTILSPEQMRSENISQALSQKILPSQTSFYHFSEAAGRTLNVYMLHRKFSIRVRWDFQPLTGVNVTQGEFNYFLAGTQLSEGCG